MLFIKGIYLLLSHLPTSHTTVRAVRHTAVSCFYTLRCVASCFQPSRRDTSLLFYCRIPSYRVNREFLFGHLTTKDSQGSSHLLLHGTIQSFPIDNPCRGYYDLCWLLTTSFTPSWYIEWFIFTHASVRPPRIRAYSFHLIPTSFTPTIPNSYRTLICLAISSMVICLIWSFCTLGQMFAACFFQIPLRSGHPCYWLYNSRY